MNYSNYILALHLWFIMLKKKNPDTTEFKQERC